MLKLTDRVNNNIIKDEKALEYFFKLNLNEFTQRINSDANLIQVILDYNSAVSLLQMKGVKIDNKFNRNTFGHLLAKVRDLGLPCWNSKVPQFKMLVMYMAKEASKQNEIYGKDIQFIFSDAFIQEAGYKPMNTFFTGINHFADIFVNTNHYGKTMIMQSAKVGDTYINDFINCFKRAIVIDALREFQTMLNDAVNDIIETQDYSL